jgi:hypothetical protein
MASVVPMIAGQAATAVRIPNTIVSANSQIDGRRLRESWCEKTGRLMDIYGSPLGNSVGHLRLSRTPSNHDLLPPRIPATTCIRLCESFGLNWPVRFRGSVL